MKIGFDLDDVLADCMPVLADFHNQHYGTQIQRNEIKEFGFGLWGGDQKNALERFNHFYASDVMQTIKPIEGAVDGIRKLKQKNFEIAIITNRPEHTKTTTMDWINKYFPDSFTNVYFASHWLGTNNLKKSDICKMLGINILVEDAPHNAIECAEKGIKVLLFDAPWNQMKEMPENMKRIRNWNEIIKELEKDDGRK